MAEPVTSGLGDRATRCLTQIYEVSNPEEARSISEIGVDHIGVLVGKGEFPRELQVEAASKVVTAVQAPSKVSVLFLTADLSLVEQWAKDLKPAIVHLGAAPELVLPEDIKLLKSRLPGVLL